MQINFYFILKCFALCFITLVSDGAIQIMARDKANLKIPKIKSLSILVCYEQLLSITFLCLDCNDSIIKISSVRN